MRRESSKERAMWTEHFTGEKQQKPCRGSKFGNRRVEFNGKIYDSIREANKAAELQGLARQNKIKDYAKQKRIVLLAGDGKLRPIVYVADFYYVDLDGTPHVLDSKGYKTKEYRLKKKLAALLLRIQIEEC
jgi:hypothetical protein